MSLAETKPRTAPARAYKRVLLKISGEALMGEGQYGIDQPTCQRMAEEVIAAVNAGTEMCLVIGGGNIFRGMQGAAKGMERASADYMGMLATVMNALAMQNAIEAVGGQARVLSAIGAVSIHRSANAPKPLASFSRRFARCFSIAGDLPSRTARLASRHISRARTRLMPSRP